MSIYDSWLMGVIIIIIIIIIDRLFTLISSHIKVR